MIICMFKIIGITNRKLCKGDFFKQIEKVIESGITTIVLREKDLNDAEYERIAERLIKICDMMNAECILHGHLKVAEKKDCAAVHIPLPELERLSERNDFDKSTKKFKKIGTSCHSIREALRAVELGCSYIFAGHIFETDCKSGLPGRGVDFLKEISENVKIPVYAIGGITPDNVNRVMIKNVSGACVMSGIMQEEPMRFEI